MEMPLSEKLEAVSPKGFSTQTLDSLLKKMRNQKVLVIGDVGIDRYTLGAVERISPEAPVPIVLVQEEKLKLGLAANVADNVHTLGGLPLLVGTVGKDRGGEDFRLLLEAAGIDSAHLIVDESRRTVLKERIVSERQQLLRVDYESPHGLDKAVEKQVLSVFQKILPTVDAVIVEDYAKGFGTRSLMDSIFRESAHAGKVVTADPNMRTPVEFYQGASVLTPNTKEAEHLSGVHIQDMASLRKAGEIILGKTGSQNVVITRGKEGMAVFSKGHSGVRIIPTYAREVYDVSGAGDTVISALTLSLASGASIEEASILGNLAAGIVVGKRGTATVTPEEIRTFHAEMTAH